MLRTNNLVQGINILCTKEDKMFMDIKLLKSVKDKQFSFLSDTQETAFLLLEGKVSISANGITKNWKRVNCFKEDASCLHISKGTKVDITILEDAEILIQAKENNNLFEPVWYDKTNIDITISGVTELQETTTRRVTTIIDKDRAPYSNMVLGEVINLPGIWSSYPPHHHPQPEVYFYKFDKPQGFGTCIIADEAYKITNNSIGLIPPGKMHPQNAAPGYAMYFVWMIPHLENDPWLKTRIYEPEHEWVNETDLKIFNLEEI